MADVRKTKSSLHNSFPIVGIGASAGGLEASQELLANLSVTSGMAFVLIQHLDPKHDSHFAQILARNTKMPVLEAVDGTVPEPNHVYIIPAPSMMVISEGKLRLAPRPETPERPLVIDRFFSSLAQDRKASAIGVILSGTGSDGSRGISEIKAEGGITFAQDQSAKHYGMPHAAISTGAVDLVLSPEKIAAELGRISSHPQMEELKKDEQESQDSENETKQKRIQAILKQLRRSSGVDFSSYKQSTIQRRIARRMMLLNMEQLQDYSKYLEKNPSEADILHQDLLIKVTSFFRDSEAFETLKTKIFPLLMKDRNDAPIRIWVPACATGEEVYSIAMCLLEYLGDEFNNQTIQIFGTDLSDACIERARSGCYTENSMIEVSEDRRRRFFSRADFGWQINKVVRDLCIFSKHNVTQDPPFSGMDLISCRNFLIYLDSSLQKRVISLFHYGLKPNGVLLLGSSESIGAFGDLFAPLDAKNRIFSKKLALHNSPFDFVRVHLDEGRTRLPPKATNKAVSAFDLTREVEHAIAARLGPCGVVINEDLQIIQVRGHTGAFLEPAPGEASHSLLKMARAGLLTDLRSAILKAKQENIVVRREGIKVQFNGGMSQVYFEILPLKAPNSEESLYIVLFGELSGHDKKKPLKKSVAESNQSSRLTELERELSSTREYLQSLIDKEQAYGEEMKSANEEILSSNEELQSTNEELETAKEELQSINEELNTLNEELQNRNRELNIAVNDLNNLLASIRLPVIMLSRDLKIRKITPGAEKIANVIPGDIGRPISDIRSDLNFSGLVPLIKEVIESVTPQAREIQDTSGRWFSLWIRPYQTHDNKIDGAVVTLFDVDALKRARDYSDAIVQTIREPLLVLDSKLQIKAANASFYETFQTTRSDIENRSLYKIKNGQWDILSLRELLEKALRSDARIHSLKVEHNDPTFGRQTFALNARKVIQSSGDPDLILLAIEDITGAENSLRETANHLIKVNMELEQFTYIAAHDLKEPLRNVSNYLQLLLKGQGTKIDKDGIDLINGAIGASRRMKSLVEDLLAFSRTGKEDLKYEPTDCSAVVQGVLGQLKPSVEESGAEVTYDNLPTIAANGRLLFQIFQNLLSNAFKFRGTAKPKITISAVRKDEEWLFCVKDNGIGIEKEYSERIFSVFQRLHGSETYPGTGIGLAICKKIVDRYGGRIWVESELGKGSSFFFTIPIKHEISHDKGNK
jgi:two-component system, chemotaxis family, CheB/CheR fusion protein